MFASAFRVVSDFATRALLLLFGNKEKTTASGIIGVALVGFIVSHFHVSENLATAIVVSLGGAVMTLIHAHGKTEAAVAINSLKSSAVTLAQAYLSSRGISVSPDEISSALSGGDLVKKLEDVALQKVMAINNLPPVLPAPAGASAQPASVAPIPKTEGSPASISAPINKVV